MAAPSLRRLNLTFFVFILAAAAVFFVRLAPTRVQEKTLRVTPLSFSELPDWRHSDPRKAFAAFRRSCDALDRKAATSQMGGIGYAGVVAEWQSLCSIAPSAMQDAASARRYFENNFQPARIEIGGAPDGLFTGYYEPELAASRTRHDGFSIPIYGLPGDLVTADLGAFKAALAGQEIIGRVEGARLVPYPGRADIDRDGLASARVLMYANDPIAVFFMHIQGSGRVLIDDGTVERLSYAGKNGRPYTAIGRTLIRRGALDRASVSLQSIRAWLKSHPAEAQDVMESDQSFVFFQETPLDDPALGSHGSEGVPLTPEASIAVDAGLHALGTPFYLVANVPSADPRQPDRHLAQLMIAQDTGGAIKGAVRADVFWGFGKAAESIAGRMKSSGRMYALLPKAVTAKMGAGKDFPVSP